MQAFTQAELYQLQETLTRRYEAAEFRRHHPEYTRPRPVVEPIKLTETECASMDETIDGVAA